jgi:hypothetical protein
MAENLDVNVVAVVLEFLLYILFLLLPLIPTAIIYKLFPETKVAVTGPFQNWTVKATGAFAAYIVTAGIGIFLIVDTTRLINAMTFPAWKIRATIDLLDEHNKEIPLEPGDLNALTVSFKPDRDQTAGNLFDMRIPLVRPEDWPSIHVGLPGFLPTHLDLSKEVSDPKAIRDNFKRTIQLPRPIVLRQTKSTESSNVYNSMAPNLSHREPIETSSAHMVISEKGGE